MIHKILRKTPAEKAKFIEFRVCDPFGRAHRFTYNAKVMDGDALKDGVIVSGKWLPAGHTCQPVLLKPDLQSMFMDPFYVEDTAVFLCDLYTIDCKPHPMDTRGLSSKTAAKLHDLMPVGVHSVFGAVLSCFIFDHVHYGSSRVGAHYSISTAGEENCATPHTHDDFSCNISCGADSPAFADDLYDIRSEITLTAEQIGVLIKRHHIGQSVNQCEFILAPMAPLAAADAIQKLKYVIHNVARSYNKSATFMPRPFGDRLRSYLYLRHDLLDKQGGNLANPKHKANKLYTQYQDGMCGYVRAFEAFTNPTTNSYCHASSYTTHKIECNNMEVGKKEHECGTKYCGEYGLTHLDAAANPYLAIPAMIAAGCQAFKKGSKANGGHECTPSRSLCGALAALEMNAGMVCQALGEPLVATYLQAKQEEMARVKHAPHPVEFELYY